MLTSSAFSDPNGDGHAASQWQISTTLGDYASPAYDNVTAINLTSKEIPTGILDYSTIYYWHVRYQDNNGAWSAYSTEWSFKTSPPGPEADFAASVTDLIAGQSVQFTDASTGQIVSWQWNFGDGTTPTTWTAKKDGKVSHTYAVAGTYSVTLKIADSNYKSYTETKPDYINVFALPKVGFSASATGILVGEAISFTSLSTGGIPPLTYAWDFDSDGVVDSTSLNPTYSYAATGTYAVSLRVTDARGNSTTEKRTGYISVGNAIAPHSIPPQGGIIQTADGQVSMTFPADAVAGGAIVSIEKASPPAATKLPSGFQTGSTCFTLSAVDGEGKEILMFARLVTITVKYSDEDVAAAGGDLNDLVLAYYNEATGKWKVVDTALNRTDKSLSVTTTHFSTWAVLAKTSSDGLASWQWTVIGLVAVMAVGIVMWKLIPARQSYRTR
jgi:PKD repeat protein